MSEPKQLVESMFDAFRRGDIQYVIDQFSEDCSVRETRSSEIPYAGAFTGKTGAKTFFDRMLTALAPGKLEADAWICDGEHVVALGSWAGTARATGKAWDSDVALYFRVKNGKVVEFRGHDDTAVVAAALRAA